MQCYNPEYVSPKTKRLWRFLNSPSIGNPIIDRGMCNLGASVNLIPLSIYERLDLDEVKPTNFLLELSDRSIKYLIGIVEEVPIRIGQLYISTDFIVMDI